MNMSNVDPRNDRQEYQNERKRIQDDIEDGSIGEDEGAALLAFGENKRESVKISTAGSQLNYIRRSAEMARAIDFPPLLEWEQGDFERFLSRLKNGEVPDRFLRFTGPDGWGEGSVRNFKNAIKQYLLYLRSRSDDNRSWTDGLGREWVEDVELGAPASAKVDPNDLLSPDELASIWNAIERLRDRALFAVAYCTWQRNAVLRSFRLDDVDLHDGGTTGVIRIFEDALGRKGASGRKPLSWSAGPVSKWMEVHPRKDEPDAPLFCSISDHGSSISGTPLSTAESVNRRFRNAAKEAGLDRDRWDTQYGRKQRTIRAHLLRYTGATRAAKSDEYAEATVKQWGNWTQSSGQLDRYIQLTDDDVLASWAAAHDIHSETFSTEQPEYGNCARCQGAVEDWLPTCPSCGHDLSESAPDTGKPMTDRLGEALSFLVEEDPDLAHDLINAAELRQGD